MIKNESLVPMCKCCGKYADELAEYKYAIEEGESIQEYVKYNEGTYNSKTNMFYCTSCYIKLGCPLGKA